MNTPRRLINLIGATTAAVILIAGSLLVVLPLFSAAQNATAQAAAAAKSDEQMRAQLAELARQEPWQTEARNGLARARWMIPAQDELRDASALASAAAKSSGARIVAISYSGRQVFTPPTGAGIGEDGRPIAPPAAAEPNTPQVQLPVTFEAEVSSMAQAAAFMDGLRIGPRLVQVVQAECSSTNGVKRFTVTVDVLIFAAKG